MALHFQDLVDIFGVPILARRFVSPFGRLFWYAFFRCNEAPASTLLKMFLQDYTIIKDYRCYCMNPPLKNNFSSISVQNRGDAVFFRAEQRDRGHDPVSDAQEPRDRSAILSFLNGIRQDTVVYGRDRRYIF